MIYDYKSARCMRLLQSRMEMPNIVVALLYLADQLAFHIIEIKVHVAVAVAREQDVLLAHDAVLHHLFLHCSITWRIIILPYPLPRKFLSTTTSSIHAFHPVGH